MPKLPNPVVVVPGIKGSSLRDEYATSPETVWSMMQAVLKSYDRITLHPYDTRYELQEPARVVRDQVFTTFYSELIEELRHDLTAKSSEPVPVFPFAYDWRAPLEIVQAQLGRFIEEVVARTALLPHYNRAGYSLPAGKVNLVGHSMGGLIIAGHLAEAGLARMDRVATIASPFRGSLEAVAMTTLGTGPLSTGGSREREAARLTPALYHLLPTFDGCVLNQNSAVLFDVTRWQKSILDTLNQFIQANRLPKNPPITAQQLLTNLLAQAKAQRENMESFQLPDSKRWLCIVGLDTPTRVNMSIGTDASGNIRFNIPGAVNQYTTSADPAQRVQTGDSTVPYLGAQCAFVPREEIICVTPHDYAFFELKDRVLSDTAGLHATLPNMNLVQRLVISHLLQRQQGDLEIDGDGHGPDVNPADWDPPVNKTWLKG